MELIVTVNFKNKNKNYYFLSTFELKKGDKVVVETERGLQLGFVFSLNDKINDTSSLKQVIRLASKDDCIQYEKNLKDEEQALLKAEKIATKLNLNMKFLEANFTLDRTQLLFHFLSDNRVDFRELAKELANIYKTRIELRQVGVRDKAKDISGIGPCGRKLCCSCFLKDLDSVSISMAKNQNLSLNPTKINGLCGRLLCCLNYEDELYKENRKKLPNVGESVDTDFGKGVVLTVNIPKKTYVVNIDGHGKEEISLLGGCGKCGNCNK